VKKKFIDYFMSIANLTSKLSYAKRLQVGAVIVKGNQIIGTGYNGMPTGWENNCEDKIWDKTGDYELKTRPEVLHAEMNCLMKVAQSTESSKDAILFTTTAPCLDCAKAIFQAGIKEVIYKDLYRSEDGLYFLEKCGIKLTKFEEVDK
jgi:dCMP deaminase